MATSVGTELDDHEHACPTSNDDAICNVLQELLMHSPDITIIPRVKPQLKVERPRLHKVLLVNDDFTPRAFVVTALRAEFRLDDNQASRVMMTAHQRGVCVVAVFTRDVAEEKATAATDRARKQGYPLLFTTEPEE